MYVYCLCMRGFGIKVYTNTCDKYFLEIDLHGIVKFHQLKIYVLSLWNWFFLFLGFSVMEVIWFLAQFSEMYYRDHDVRPPVSKLAPKKWVW